MSIQYLIKELLHVIQIFVIIALGQVLQGRGGVRGETRGKAGAVDVGECVGTANCRCVLILVEEDTITDQTGNLGFRTSSSLEIAQIFDNFTVWDGWAMTLNVFELSEVTKKLIYTAQFCPHILFMMELIM